MMKTFTAVARKVRRLIGGTVLLASVTLSGCYLAGSIATLDKPTYRARGAVDMTLRVDGEDVRIVAPLACKSFVHPVGGGRVTRDDGNLFVVTLNKGERAILRFGHGCETSDAAITPCFNCAHYLYRVSVSPRRTVTQDVIVLEKHPDAGLAHVLMRRGFLTPWTADTNALPVDNLGAALKSIGLDSDGVAYMTRYSREILVDGPLVNRDDAASLGKLSGTQPVDMTIRKRINANWTSTNAWNGNGSDASISETMRTASFDFDEKDAVFKPGEARPDRLIYFEMPASVCPRDSSYCSHWRVPSRIGELDVPLDDVRMMLHSAERRIYVPQGRTLR